MASIHPLTAGLAYNAGQYTADGDDASAGTLTIPTGFHPPFTSGDVPGAGDARKGVTTFLVQVYRSDVQVTADADISLNSEHDLVVADGSATYAVTSGDVVHWAAFGIY